MAKRKINEATERAIAMAEAAGYPIWQTGGGCEAFGKSLKEVPVEDDVADLTVLITTEGGTDIDGDPDEAIWEVGVNYQDPDGGDTVESEEGLTLAAAIEVARGYEARAEELWEANFPGQAAKP